MYKILQNSAIRRLLYKLLSKGHRNNSFKMAIINNDYISNEIQIHGWYEDHFLKLLKFILNSSELEKDKSMIIDVGANIGNHSMFFSELVDSVIAIEPNPICNNLIHASLMFNNISNISVIQKALSSHTGKATLNFPASDLGSGSLLDSDSKGFENSFEVETDTLDNILALKITKDEHIKLIKIDVEGHELEILKGAKTILNEHSPIIAFEAHGLINYVKLTNELKKLGYLSFYKLTQSRRLYKNHFLNTLNMLFRPSMLSIKKITNPKDENYQMVLAFKKKNIDKLDALDGYFKA